MQKITDYIFDFSPKKLSIFLVLGPLALFFVHTVYTIVYRKISDSSPSQEIGAQLILGILILCLAALALLWLFWLRGTVNFVTESQLGLPRKWFQIAYTLLWVYVGYTFAIVIIEPFLNAQSYGEDYLFLIYASRESVSFVGILIAYPIVCHYAARAATAKRNETPATFVQAIPFTLILIFGTVLGVPFLQKYFSTTPSTNTQIVSIYAIAFALFLLILVMGFIAAITGLD